jgi:hypothetical protein
MSNTNPLDNALSLGEDVREQLLSARGGTINTKGVVKLLGVSRQTLQNRRRLGRLIGMRLPNGEYAYPVWQFNGRRSLEGLEQVLAELKDCDPWMQAAFMLNDNSRLGWESPLDVLIRGEIERAIAAAREYGKQGLA